MSKQPTKQYIKDLDVNLLLGQEGPAEIPDHLPRREWLYKWLLDPNTPGNYHKDIDKWIGLLIFRRRRRHSMRRLYDMSSCEINSSFSLEICIRPLIIRTALVELVLKD